MRTRIEVADSALTYEVARDPVTLRWAWRVRDRRDAGAVKRDAGLLAQGLSDSESLAQAECRAVLWRECATRSTRWAEAAEQLAAEMRRV